MHTSIKLGSNQNTQQIDNVIRLIKGNADCTKDLIYHIDDLIETKRLPEYIKEALIMHRNACVINTMNSTKTILSI